MALRDLSEHAAVLRALREFDRLGEDAFLERHGFGRARDYFLVHDGRWYPSKAIAGVAHGYQFPDLGPLSSEEFSGGQDHAAKRLLALGFTIERAAPATDATTAQVGAVPGVAVGATFETRADVRAAGLHRYLINGIDYDRASGLSVAIVLNGGYADDVDNGTTVTYTGEGGRDQSRRHQVRDQEWTRGNAGLRRAQTGGVPVRIIRGSRPTNEFAPSSGYRYDGLYSVVGADLVPSADGPLVCQFQLEALDGEAGFPAPAGARSSEGRSGPSPRIPSLSMRVVRDTLVAREVKQLHDYRCQACGVRLDTPSGPYAEGAHIRPLGSPHDGPDRLDNLLCLCPNHHVLFDKGAWHIDADGRVQGLEGSEEPGVLRTLVAHPIDQEALRYHRERVAGQA